MKLEVKVSEVMELIKAVQEVLQANLEMSCFYSVKFF